jgi:hypothetical protein
MQLVGLSGFFHRNLRPASGIETETIAPIGFILETIPRGQIAQSLSATSIVAEPLGPRAKKANV